MLDVLANITPDQVDRLIDLALILATAFLGHRGYRAVRDSRRPPPR